MLKRVLSVVLLLLVVISNSFAQGESAVPFLLIQPGPNLNGMARAFTALPTLDAFGHYYNPAQLGNFSRERNFSVQFYPSPVIWLPQFNFSDLTFNSTAISAGYNLEKLFPEVPVSVGVGYLDTKLDLGWNIVVDENGTEVGRFQSWESYTAYAIGLGIDYFIRLNVGYTIKKIESKLAQNSIKADAEDYGMQLVVPIIKITEKVSNFKLVFKNDFEPLLDISMGYAITNVGDKIIYLDAVQKDPLPKQAKIGYALSFGINKQIKDMEVTVFKLDWSSEAMDRLINRDSAGNSEYVSSPGEIKIWDNVFLGKSDKNITINKGWRINIFEIIQYSRGSIRGSYYSINQRASGLMLSTRGLIKWLAVERDNPVLNFFAHHVDVEYSRMKYSSTNPLDATEFEGIAISIYGY